MASNSSSGLPGTNSTMMTQTGPAHSSSTASLHTPLAATPAPGAFVAAPAIATLWQPTVGGAYSTAHTDGPASGQATPLAPPPAMRFASATLPLGPYTDVGTATVATAAEVTRSTTPRPAMIASYPGGVTTASTSAVIIRRSSSPTGLRPQSPLRSVPVQRTVPAAGVTLQSVSSHSRLPQLSSLPPQGLRSTGGNAITIGSTPSSPNESTFPTLGDVGKLKSGAATSNDAVSLSQSVELSSRLSVLENYISELSSQYQALAQTVTEMPRKLNEIVAGAVNELGAYDVLASRVAAVEKNTPIVAGLDARVRALEAEGSARGLSENRHESTSTANVAEQEYPKMEGEAAELVNKRLDDLEKRLAEDFPSVLEQCAIARSMTENTKARVSVLEASGLDVELQAMSNRIEDVVNELSEEIRLVRDQQQLSNKHYLAEKVSDAAKVAEAFTANCQSSADGIGGAGKPPHEGAGVPEDVQRNAAQDNVTIGNTSVSASGTPRANDITPSPTFGG